MLHIHYGYTKSDYVGCSNSTKSTSGYIFEFLGGAISWRSRLQESTALSTIEPEYVVASKACKEVIWLSRLACDMGIPKLVAEMYPLLHIQTLIMLAIPATQNPLRGIFFSLWEVPYLGDLMSNSLLLSPLQKRNML